MAVIVSRRARRRRSLIAFALGAALAAPSPARAQDNSAAPAPPAATQAAPAPRAAPAAPAAGSEQGPPAQSLFTRAELEKLLAPIALYPDALLAQLLAASAYPIEIVEAQRWLDNNKAAVANKDFSWIDSRDWDPAVKAMARFPDVIEKMSDDLDWTTDLGDAEVNQPQDVADVIQELRAEAEKAGALKTTPQQTVSSVFVDDGSYITIEPAEPSVVYVPSYEPAVEPVVAVAPLVTFGAGIVVGAPLHRRCWNWRTGAIYPPVWAGYPGWRPGQPFWLGGRPVGANINVGNNLKPWRPGPDYRPRLGPGVGANRAGDESIIINRSPDGKTITVRGGNRIDRLDGGNNIVNARPAAGNFVDTRPAGNFVDTRPAASNFVNTPPARNFVNIRPGAGNFVDTRPAGNFVDTRPAGNFVDTRPAVSNFVNTPPARNFVNIRPGAGNFVDTRPAAGNFVNSRAGGKIIVFGHPNDVNVINRAPGVAVTPRIAPVLPNFSPRGAPAMSGIRLGVGAIPSANRGVIGHGLASGGLVGGAVARPGGFGIGGFGAGLR